MTLVERFQQYAEDFERSQVDGDWNRLRKHFAEGVVHERHVGELYNFRDEGIDRVIERFEEAVENIDRRFDRRILVPTGPVAESGNQVQMPWVCLFLVEGAPACVDEGVEIATFMFDNALTGVGLYNFDVVWPVGPRIQPWLEGIRYRDLRNINGYEYIRPRE